MTIRRRVRLAGRFCLAALTLASTTALAAPESFRNAVLADDPALYFPLDETEGAALNYGSLGEDFHATYFGTPHRGAATFEGDAGVRFDDIEDYLETGAVAPAQFLGNPTMSAEAVFFLTPQDLATTWAPFLHWGPSPLGSPTMKSVYFSFSGNSPEEVFAGFYNGGLQTAVLVPRGHWHHVVWVRQGGGAANVGTTVYIDGQVVGLINDPELPFNTSTPAVEATEFRINRARDLNRYFTGTLDEVALYDFALTPEQVQAHFEALIPCQQEDVPGQCFDYDESCRSCAQPISNGSNPLASDALGTLRAAVGSRLCRRCVCDVDGSGTIVATDSLLTLKRAVGQPVDLLCPAGLLPFD